MAGEIKLKKTELFQKNILILKELTMSSIVTAVIILTP